MIFSVIAILCCGFFFREANTFKEYTESIYISSVSLTLLSTNAFVIWKMENIFFFIDTWEEIVAKSK